MTNQNGQLRPTELSRQIDAVEFALTETVLYLDAYPENRRALEFYQALLAERTRLLEQYEKTVGPLTAHGNRSTTDWDWVNTPWPWESAANC